MRVYVDIADGCVQSSIIQAVQAAEHEVVTASASASLSSLLPSLDAVLLELTVADGDAEQRLMDGLTAIAAADAQQPLTVIGLSSFLSSAGATGRKPLREPAFKKRQAAAQHAALRSREVLLLQLQREAVTPVVVCSGLVYGEGESALLPLFRSAWLCEPLPVIGAGDNVIPCIHAQDLAAVVCRCLQSPPASSCPFVYACDESSTRQSDLVAAVSAQLGSAQLSRVELAAAVSSPPFSSPSTSPLLLSLLTADARLEPDYIRSLEPPLSFCSPSGPVSALPSLIAAFVSRRRLQPLRLLVSGPPCSGKSHWARRLAARWRLPVLRIGEVVEEARMRGDEMTAEINAEMEREAQAAAEREKAAAGKDSKKGGAAASKKAAAAGDGKEASAVSAAPRLALPLLTRLMRRRLQEDARCRNAGFVLDGFPRTREEAEALLLLPPAQPAGAEQQHDGGEEEKTNAAEAMPEAETGQQAEKVETEAAEGAKAESAVAAPPALEADPATFPSCVLRLRCSEASAAARLRCLPAAEVLPGHSDESGFKRRWALWQQREAGRQTAADALDSRIPALELSDDLLGGGDDAAVMQQIALLLDAGGGRQNFHPTEEEQREEAQRLRAEAAACSAEEQRRQREAEAEVQRRAAERLQADAERRRRVTEEEAALLEAAAAPLRAFLLREVLPPVMDGLLDVCRQRPDDPVDHLADFLFKYAVNVQHSDSSSTPQTTAADAAEVQ